MEVVIVYKYVYVCMYIYIYILHCVILCFVGPGRLRRGAGLPRQASGEPQRLRDPRDVLPRGRGRLARGEVRPTPGGIL